MQPYDEHCQERLGDGHVITCEYIVSRLLVQVHNLPAL